MSHKTPSLILASLLALLLPTQAHAQILKLGVTGGLDINEIRLHEVVKDERNWQGWYAGLTLDLSIPLTGFSVDVSGLYNRSSFNSRGDNEKLDFITVPINVKYMLGNPNVAAVFVATGPQLSFSVNDHDEILHRQYRLKDSNLSWNFGGGIRLFKHIQAAYRYNVGIGPYANHYNADGIWTSVRKHGGTHHVALTLFL